MKCKKINVVIALKLLIIKYITEKKNIFYIHNSIVNSNVEFIYKIYFNYEFDELKSYQWLNFIKKILNENCFKNFIIKIVILDDNV